MIVEHRGLFQFSSDRSENFRYWDPSWKVGPRPTPPAHPRTTRLRGTRAVAGGAISRSGRAAGPGSEGCLDRGFGCGSAVGASWVCSWHGRHAVLFDRTGGAVGSCFSVWMFLPRCRSFRKLSLNSHLPGRFLEPSWKVGVHAPEYLGNNVM